MLLRYINNGHSLSNPAEKKARGGKKKLRQGEGKKERGGGRPGIKIRLAL